MTTIAEALGAFCAEHNLNLSSIDGTLKLAETLRERNLFLFGTFYGLPNEKFLETLNAAERHQRILEQI